VEEILGHTLDQLKMIMHGIGKLRGKSKNKESRHIDDVKDIMNSGLPIKVKK
jgi:hypothetical protein